jgi:hypothetical protein
MGGGMKRPRGPRKDPPITRDLPVSLEDLYTGVTKKLKITRKVAVRGSDGDGYVDEDKILTVDVKPGWKVRFVGGPCCTSVQLLWYLPCGIMWRSI